MGATFIVKQSPKITIATGQRHTVALQSDGTLVAAGDNKCGQCKVGDWRDIAAVATGNVDH
ncbi:RCC1-like domain-containing protein [Cohnella sp. GCM10020058]|uniref:RCC1-like domain-containing protein n=1 Tax=Cohnella sp. GCM10020058 TaxID=3317330 RepID=UPI003624EAC5